MGSKRLPFRRQNKAQRNKRASRTVIQEHLEAMAMVFSRGDAAQRLRRSPYTEDGDQDAQAQLRQRRDRGKQPGDPFEDLF